MTDSKSTSLKWLLLLAAVALSVFALGCSPQQGTLEFRANGEDFVREGFVSKDGWRIDFDTVEVTINELAGFQTDGQFQASSGTMPDGTQVGADDTFTIDLARGDADADPILVVALDAPVGHYDAISWAMVNDDGGQTIRLVGSAEKDNQTVAFNLSIDETYAYVCGEYVGDSRTGFVDEGTTDDLEMTFHFDHVFGDFETDAADDLNVGALGFAPLAALATDGTLDLTFSQLGSMLSQDDFTKLSTTLGTLGHVGEGHCFEATYGYTDTEG